jgi:hypothetical protein
VTGERSEARVRGRVRTSEGEQSLGVRQYHCRGKENVEMGMGFGIRDAPSATCIAALILGSSASGMLKDASLGFACREGNLPCAVNQNYHVHRDFEVDVPLIAPSTTSTTRISSRAEIWLTPFCCPRPRDSCPSTRNSWLSLDNWRGIAMLLDI